MGLRLRYIVHAAIACGLVACSQGKGDTSAAVASGPVVAPGPSAPASEGSAAPAAVQLPGKAGSTIDRAATSAVGVAVDGEVLKNDQNDFYRFDVTSKLRDLAVVRLQNQSNTLRPYLKFYDADRKQLVENYDNTAGASIERTMTLEPGETFYVQVLAYNSTGKYTLSVVPKKAYDANEPNDDALSATPAKIDVASEGSILDEKDTDWFRISGARSPSVRVKLDNLSSTLRPYVKVYSATKSQILEKYDSTAGADLDFTVDIEAGQGFLSCSAALQQHWQVQAHRNGAAVDRRKVDRNGFTSAGEWPTSKAVANSSPLSLRGKGRGASSGEL